MKIRFCVLSLLVAGALAAPAAASDLVFTPFHADGIYALGDKIGWTVTAEPGEADSGSYTYTVKENQLTPIASGSFDLSSGSATITVAVDHPTTLYVTVKQAGAPAGPVPVQAAVCPPPAAAKPVAFLGAVVAPTLLKPVVPRPADFDAFWTDKIAALDKVPMHPLLTRIASGQPGVTVYMVRLDSLGSHVHGYLAVPDRKGRFPALVIYQWAGVYPLSPEWAADRAAEGWLTFDVDSHDVRPDETAGVPLDYQDVGDTSRETSYFLDMYLRDTRALDWVRTLKHWDHKTLVLNGTSMGGQQSVVTAGLNPGKITALIVNEPSGADTNGDLHGRKSGYPNWDNSDPRVAQTALYFDTVNFAPHITAPTLMAIGFIDRTCPPAGLWTELNEIPAPKEVVPMVESDHNNITPDKQGDYLQRSEEVLANLLIGHRFSPDEALTRPQH